MSGAILPRLQLLNLQPSHLIQDDFRRDIFRRATKRPGLLSEPDPLGEPEINDFDVATFVEEEVLRFKIPVDDPFGVEVVEPLHYAPNYKLAAVLVKLLPGEMRVFK